MILLQQEDINSEFIYFGNPIRNNIIKDGYFRHINYSTHSFSLNTIYINIERLTHDFIEKIAQLEDEILTPIHKIKQLNLQQYLLDVKVNHHLLKISGLWETSTHCGLSFKFLSIR
jgi:hypothetical protein